MPVSGWNGKFRGQGNGGFAGEIDYGGLALAVSQGYASGGTDTGHAGSGTDASWEQERWQIAYPSASHWLGNGSV